MSQNHPPLVVVSFNDRIVAMDARTGQRAWELETGVKEGYGLLRVEGTHVLYVVRKKMLCADYLSGRLLWAADLPWATPRMIVFGGCIVLNTIGEVAGYSLADGSQLWHDEFRGYGIHGGAMAVPGAVEPIDRWRG